MGRLCYGQLSISSMRGCGTQTIMALRPLLSLLRFADDEASYWRSGVLVIAKIMEGG